MNIQRHLQLAADISRLKDDERTYFHGAIGIRRDGVLVAAYNGNPKTPTPEAHAEARLLRKLGKGGIVFVVRTLADGTWADSKPCIHCQKAMYARGVKFVYHSCSPDFHSGFNWSIRTPASLLDI